jgi:hypothetical protein
VSCFEITIVGVIGSYQEDDRFGRFLEVYFAVLKVPENLFSSITVVSEIDSVQRSEVSVPDFLHRLILAAQFTECMSDRVTNEDHVVISVFGRLYFLIMSGTGRRAGIVRIT